MTRIETGWAAVALALASATLIALAILYPFVAKIRRRDRPYRIQLISEPENPKFDIVAIQGLGADPDYTWTCKGPVDPDHPDKVARVHLLRDLLKPDFDEARILSFPYNSDWLINSPVTTAREIANRLIEELQKDRLHRPRIPIVFICHSFGGIVLKEALSGPGDDSRDILDSTDGIIFLGTPHYGSEVALAGAVVTSFTGFLGSSNTLLLSLKYGETQLVDLDRRFRKCMEQKKARRETKIFCFYEKMPTLLLGWFSIGIIVTEFSAMGCATNIESIDTDHSGLNKCSRREDQLYQKLSHVLGTLRPTTDPILNGDQEYVVDKLAAYTVTDAAFDSDENKGILECYGDTRADLIHQIDEWVNSKTGCIFWLQGSAGTGKSTISKTVARRLRGKSDGENRLGASFFFRRSDDHRSKAASFFTTIASQLVQNFAPIAQGVRNTLESKDNPVKKEKNLQFKKLVLGPLEKLHEKGVCLQTMVVVIDALDECDNKNDVAVILDCLLQLKNLACIPLKVFVTSRPEVFVRSNFNRTGDLCDTTILDKVELSSIRRDIAAFLTSSLKKTADEFNNSPILGLEKLPAGWPSQEKLQNLVGMAVPLFIFAATACRFIGDEKQRGSPKDRLERILKYRSMYHESNPDPMAVRDVEVAYLPNLKATYLPALDHMLELEGPDRRDTLMEFNKIVGSIIVLINPLPVSALATLLEIKVGDVGKMLYGLYSVLNVPSDSRAPVKLFHQSFRDFLIHHDKRANEFWVDEKQAHQALAENCIQLMSKCFKPESGTDRPRVLIDICDTSQPGTLLTEVDSKQVKQHLLPEMQYACLYWIPHLQKSHYQLHNGQVHCFLQKHLLHWLEALGWMGKVSEGVSAILALESITAACDYPQLSEYVHDAKRFVLYNRSAIEQAPLQTYCSALVFAPKMSIVRKQFKDCMPQWIQTLPKVENNWNALVQTLEGHKSPVLAVAFSPDHIVLASASADNTVRLWEAATGAALQTLEGHTASVKTVAFSLDGEVVISVSYDNTIRLWDVATGASLQTLEGHTGYINVTVRSPVLVRDSYQIDWLWDAAMGAALYKSSDGKLVASTSADNTVQLSDAATGVALERDLEYSDHFDITAVAFSLDSKVVASASYRAGYGRVRLWDVATGAALQTLEGYTNTVLAAAFSLDSKMLVSGAFDSTVTLWDTVSGAPLKTLKGHTFPVTAVAFSPDGKVVASSSYDQTIQLWDVVNGVILQRLEGHTKHVKSIAFSPDSKLVASGSSGDGVRLWDAVTGAAIQKLEGHTDTVQAVAFSLDSKMLASAASDNTVRLWDIAMVAAPHTLEGHTESIESIEFSPDGKIVASASLDKTVRLWDAATGVALQRLKSLSNMRDTIAFSPDSRVVTSVSNDYIVWLWDVVTGAALQRLKGHIGTVTAVSFSPDGKVVASSSYDNTVRLWEATTGTVLQRLKGLRSGANTVAFSPDGRVVAASAPYGRTVRLWDAATGGALQILDGSAHTRAVTFSPDSRMIAASFDNYTVQLWDVATGTALQTLKGYTRKIMAVAISPDGKVVASASSDNTVRLWDAATGSVQQTLKSCLVQKLAFSREGPYLETDRGLLHIQADSGTVFAPKLQPLCTAFIRENWITQGETNLLWLPPEYRPSCSAVRGNLFVLGYPLGLVTFIRFRL